MLLLIFGTGASYDSWSDIAPDTPAGRIPLANELFNVKYARFVLPQMRSIVPLLRPRWDGTVLNVERQLEVLRSEADTFPERSTQLLAVRYYLSTMLAAVESEWIQESASVSNYRTLFDELNMLLPNDQIAVVTFNYDHLAERAIQSNSARKFEGVGDYVLPGQRWNLYKLHGSLGWVRKVTVDRGPSSGPNWNAGASPFAWVKTADEILAKAVRKRPAISESRH